MDDKDRKFYRHRDNFKMDDGQRANSIKSDLSISDDGCDTTTSKPGSLWPEGCLYFDRRVMDPAAIWAVLDSDTQYSSTPGTTTTTSAQRSPRSAASAILVSDDGSITTHVQPPSVPWGPFWRQRLLVNKGSRQSRYAVMFVAQKRAYMLDSSVSRMALSRTDWLQLLSGTNILPSFLQVLHCTDAACARHISLTARSPGSSQNYRTLHLSIKVGGWAGNELAVYARQPLHPGGRSFFLFVGTEHNVNCKDFADRLAGVQHSDVFWTFLLLLERVCTVVDRRRWVLDYQTQELEAITGHSHFQQPWRAQPALLGELSFSQKLQEYAGRGRCVAWACARYDETITFLEKQYAEYRAQIKAQTLVETQANVPHPLVGAIDAATAYDDDTTTLLDAFAQIKSLIRGHGTIVTELLARIEAQQQITRTLIVSRDSNTTIEIGKAAKQDSEVMRSIAFVTMVFLPATFMATFFSMVFFRLRDGEDGRDLDGIVGRLRFDPSVWLYPVVTVPVTLLVWVWYRFRTVRNSTSSLKAMQEKNPRHEC